MAGAYAHVTYDFAPLGSASTTTSYDVWLGEKQVTSANKDDILADGTAGYDPDTRTLTLKGYNGDYIYASQALTIALAGGTTNTITVSETTSKFGINTVGECKLTGAGNLSIIAKAEAYDGIYAEHTASEAQDGNLIIDMSGNLTVNAKSEGIQADDSITASGSGNITVTAGYNGIYAGGGKLTIGGSGALIVNAQNDGIWAHKDIEIGGSRKVTANAADRSLRPCYGHLILSGSGSVTAISTEGSAVESDYNGPAVELNGTGSPLTFTAGSGTNSQAVSNECATGTLVEGTSFANYEATGAPSSKSVEYALKSSTHNHSWSTDWTTNATHHWRECTAENCDITDNSKKEDYGPHTGGTATNTTQAVCSDCGRKYGSMVDAAFEDTNTDGKYYASIEEAISSGASSVKLLCDMDSITINSDESITLDLNGRTVTTLTNNGTVTIPYNSDTTGGSITTLNGSGTLKGGIVLDGDSEMTINGGTIDAEIDTYDNSELTINDGTINGEIDAHDSSVVVIEDGTFKNEVESRDNSTMTVNGGSFTDDLNSRGSSTLTVNNGTFDLQADSVDSSTMIINNGTFKQITECRDDSNMTINGGTFSDDRDDKDVALKLVHKGKLKVKGGTFLNSVVNEGEADSSLEITGGIYAEDPIELLGKDYDAIQNADGRFEVAAHTHTWEEAWSHDATNHWHSCTSQRCDIVDSLGEHIHNVAEPTEDTAKVCTVCERVLAEKLEHAPMLVEGYEATTEAPGKKDYYHCDNCNRNYADPTSMFEITDDLEAWRYIPMIIAIVDGDGQEWTKGTNADLTFKSNADFAVFTRVEVDGEEVDAANYTAAEGSTIVTLKASYLEALSVGQHKIVIVSANDAPEAAFTVKAANSNNGGTTGGNKESNGGTTGGNKENNGSITRGNTDRGGNNGGNVNTVNKIRPRTGVTVPQTGDRNDVFMWIALLFVGLGGLTTAISYRKKKAIK